MKNYWETEYKDLCEGVTFRFRKMNAIEHLNLVTKNVDFENMDGGRAEYFIQKCLENTMWSRDGENWAKLIDSEGNAKLKELDTNPSIGLDLFYYFKKEVLIPVFLESKTFQNSMRAEAEKAEEE